MQGTKDIVVLLSAVSVAMAAKDLVVKEESYLDENLTSSWKQTKLHKGKGHHKHKSKRKNK